MIGSSVVVRRSVVDCGCSIRPCIGLNVVGERAIDDRLQKAVEQVGNSSSVVREALWYASLCVPELIKLPPDPDVTAPGPLPLLFGPGFDQRLCVAFGQRHVIISS